MINSTRTSQEKIYLDLYEHNKGTPMAVSSESQAHKSLRFTQISDLFKNDDNFSVHDIGMGLADFYKFLSDKFPEKNISYSGSDILKEFVDESKAKYPYCEFYSRDIAEEVFPDRYDYLIMSGIFHQRRDSSIPAWEGFYQQIITNAFEMCTKGIAFNFISPFVDFYQTQVYYCNIYKLITFIPDKLSRFFSIRHNYALFEFTVFVYKEGYIKKQYPQAEFGKYFKDLD